MLLLRIYGTLWCLHQLVPFVDALIRAAMRAAGADGIAVGFAAMDNRMLGAVDFYTRLPAVLLSLVALARLPKNGAAAVTLLSLAHIINIASWWYWMPRVWDYMVWCALLEAGFVLVAACGGGAATIGRRNARVMKSTLIVLYFSAAWWKLTSGWFDLKGSCAPTLMAELFSSKIFAHPAIEPLLIELVKLSPLLVAGLEFAVPTLLWLTPRWGVVLALVGFHQIINLMPVTVRRRRRRRS